MAAPGPNVGVHCSLGRGWNYLSSQEPHLPSLPALLCNAGLSLWRSAWDCPLLSLQQTHGALLASQDGSSLFLLICPLLSQSQDCIAGALACSKILKELSKEEDDTDSMEEMLTLAEEYEHRAVGERCYHMPGPLHAVICSPLAGGPLAQAAAAHVSRSRDPRVNLCSQQLTGDNSVALSAPASVWSHCSFS